MVVDSLRVFSFGFAQDRSFGFAQDRLFGFAPELRVAKTFFRRSLRACDFLPSQFFVILERSASMMFFYIYLKRGAKSLCIVPQKRSKVAEAKYIGPFGFAQGRLFTSRSRFSYNKLYSGAPFRMTKRGNIA